MEKQCNTCKQIKDIENFFFIRKTKKGNLYRAKCNDCYNISNNTRYRNKSKEERRRLYERARSNTTEEKKKEYRLKHRFGLSYEEYDDMLKKQNGCCYICEKKNQRKRGES